MPKSVAYCNLTNCMRIRLVSSVVHLIKVPAQSVSEDCRSRLGTYVTPCFTESNSWKNFSRWSFVFIEWGKFFVVRQTGRTPKSSSMKQFIRVTIAFKKTRRRKNNIIFPRVLEKYDVVVIFYSADSFACIVNNVHFCTSRFYHNYKIIAFFFFAHHVHYESIWNYVARIVSFISHPFYRRKKISLYFLHPTYYVQKFSK